MLALACFFPVKLLVIKKKNGHSEWRLNGSPVATGMYFDSEWMLLIISVNKLVVFSGWLPTMKVH